MTLDLNMGYYTIELSPKIRDITTIINVFWKLRYIRAPMGLYDSGDMIQSKVDEIFSDMEGVNMFIRNILVLGKGRFYQHIYHPRFIFDRLSYSVIKVNTTK